MPFCFAFVAGLHSLHIHNATIEFSSELQPIMTTPTCTVRLSNVKVIVSSGVERHLSVPDEQHQHRLLIAQGHNTTLTMENCVLKATFDSPSLFNLVACTAEEGGQV
jgi:hypothetical protein